MNYYEIFGIMASVVSIIAFIPYVRSIFKKETKPSGASWWTWTLLNLVALVSARYAGAPWPVLFLPLWLCVSELWVAILSIKYGDNNWDFLNKMCVLGALFGVCLWILTGEPLIAFSISIVADGLASIPNWRHVFTNPEQENRLAWTLGWGSAILEIFAIKTWSLAESGWAIYLLTSMTITLLLVYRPVFKKIK